MTPRTPPPAGRGPTRGGTALTLGGALTVGIGLVLVGSGLGAPIAVPAAPDLLAVPTSTASSPASPSASSVASPSPSPPMASRPTPSSTPSAIVQLSSRPIEPLEPFGPRWTQSVPSRVRIPAADVNASTVKLGLTAAGALDTPRDPDQVGWFAGANTPGGPGVAVLAGHVTWNGRPSAFFGLGTLDRGARVAVARDDGSTVIFAVTRRSTFPKSSFPTREVYRVTDRPTLVLITCGGEYDVDRRSYDSNVIVWADLVAVRPPAG